MKVLVDYDLCEGHGLCVDAAPDVFDMDDDGEKVVLLQESPPEERRPDILEAIRSCPVMALRLEE